MGPERSAPSGDFAKIMRELAPYLGLGTTLAITVGLACALGYWLDEKLGTSPGLALVFGILGVGAALVQFVRVASQMKPKSPSQPPPQS
jgi:F0F1-type ATP synthase assembly protein I